MRQAKLNFLRIASNEASRAAAKVYEYSKETEYEHLASTNFNQAFKLSASIQKEYHENFPMDCPCSDCIKNRTKKLWATSPKINTKQLNATEDLNQVPAHGGHMILLTIGNTQ